MAAKKEQKATGNGSTDSILEDMVPETPERTAVSDDDDGDDAPEVKVTVHQQRGKSRERAPAAPTNYDPLEDLIPAGASSETVTVHRDGHQDRRLTKGKDFDVGLCGQITVVPHGRKPADLVREQWGGGNYRLCSRKHPHGVDLVLPGKPLWVSPPDDADEDDESDDESAYTRYRRMGYYNQPGALSEAAFGGPHYSPGYGYPYHHYGAPAGGPGAPPPHPVAPPMGPFAPPQSDEKARELERRLEQEREESRRRHEDLVREIKDSAKQESFAADMLKMMVQSQQADATRHQQLMEQREKLLEHQREEAKLELARREADRKEREAAEMRKHEKELEQRREEAKAERDRQQEANKQFMQMMRLGHEDSGRAIDHMTRMMGTLQQWQQIAQGPGSEEAARIEAWKGLVGEAAPAVGALFGGGGGAPPGMPALPMPPPGMANVVGPNGQVIPIPIEVLRNIPAEAIAPSPQIDSQGAPPMPAQAPMPGQPPQPAVPQPAAPPTRGSMAGQPIAVRLANVLRVATDLIKTQGSDPEEFARQLAEAHVPESARVHADIVGVIRGYDSVDVLLSRISAFGESMVPPDLQPHLRDFLAVARTPEGAAWVGRFLEALKREQV